jgi:hypothetical protein
MAVIRPIVHVDEVPERPIEVEEDVLDRHVGSL